MPKIKKIYVGTNLVRPIKKIECDFTQSDFWFVFAARTSTHPSYWRNSGWLYITQSWNYQEAVARKIPSDIYSLGNLKKLELVVRRDGGSALWGWICTWANANHFSFIWDFLNIYWGNTTTSVTTVGTSAGTDYIITVDIANSELYMSNSSTKVTIPSVDITSFNTDRTAGNANITVLLRWASTAYIKKATFEIYG